MSIKELESLLSFGLDVSGKRQPREAWWNKARFAILENTGHAPCKLHAEKKRWLENDDFLLQLSDCRGCDRRQALYTIVFRLSTCTAACKPWRYGYACAEEDRFEMIGLCIDCRVNVLGMISDERNYRSKLSTAVTDFASRHLLPELADSIRSFLVTVSLTCWHCRYPSAEVPFAANLPDIFDAAN